MRTPTISTLRLRLIAAACALTIAPASNVMAIGLLQAYQAALKNDPTHQAAKAENVAGKEYKSMGLAGLLPTVQYSYSTAKNKGEITSPNFLGMMQTRPQDYRSFGNNLSLRQPLFNVDAYARYKQGIAQTNASDAQFDARSSDLMIRVVGAYSDAKYAEDQLNLITAQRDAYAEQKRLNERLFEKGEGTRTDMLETQAKLDLAETSLIEAKDALANARSVLASMIGMDAQNLDSLRDDFKVQPLSNSNLEEWKKTTLANSPEIAAARFAVESAQLEITKSRAGHMPRVDFNASVNRGKSESISVVNQESNIRSLGVQLVVPLYSGGYVNAVSKQAIARHEKARFDLETTTSKLHNEVQKQLNAVNSNAAKIDALQKSVASANLLVEATKQSVKGGVRINLDLLNAQQQLVSTKRDLAMARYNYLLSYLKLRVAAGTVNFDDFQTVASYFSVAN